MGMQSLDMAESAKGGIALIVKNFDKNKKGYNW